MRWLTSGILATAVAFWTRPVTGESCSQAASDVTELKTRLSNSTLIYLPGTPEFTAASSRWSVLDAPTPNIVVVPGTENDVALTVFAIPLSHFFLETRFRSTTSLTR